MLCVARQLYDFLVLLEFTQTDGTLLGPCLWIGFKLSFGKSLQNVRCSSSPLWAVGLSHVVAEAGKADSHTACHEEALAEGNVSDENHEAKR